MRFWIRLVLMAAIVLVPFWSKKTKCLKNDHIHHLLLDSIDHAFIGSSRMRAALSPVHFQERFALDGDLQNISVDGSTTSYGPELLRFARNKIAKSGPANRLFILEWHPSMLKSNPSEELQGSRESGKMLHKLWVQILDPPIEYFMRPVVGGASWYERKCPLVAPVNPSGWMNLEFRGSALDPNMFGAIRNRHAKLVRSTEREKAFLQLVEDLSAMGDVVVLKRKPPVTGVLH